LNLWGVIEKVVFICHQRILNEFGFIRIIFLASQAFWFLWIYLFCVINGNLFSLFISIIYKSFFEFLTFMLFNIDIFLNYIDPLFFINFIDIELSIISIDQEALILPLINSFVRFTKHFHLNWYILLLKTFYKLQIFFNSQLHLLFKTLFVLVVSSNFFQEIFVSFCVWHLIPPAQRSFLFDWINWNGVM